ncbi:bifunctional sugar-binding transcriptional regulator/dihydroxyacetone kinase subunit DhaK [Aureimonas glaciei]|jgi:dihydroxyacetone kinase-like protein|uniref:Dihydroxyacetone kinase n=1 Tax=Aureimonas glaciei TaxID=1776957 RepID=A0A917D8T2_9HYPH|nr:bifunctional sugar-binding transcriptional regulator/dihydroxyacetone kinase subunit DhaK [Aureimonas glaciei]GGD10096.1 dihydroxyacetone kinase [Aureimonas glaciei]
MARQNVSSLVRDPVAAAPAGGAPAIPWHFQDDPLLWAGWLYVQDGLTQSDIAKVMGVSRATVNGYLAEARRTGIVSLSMEATRLGEFSVAQALKQHFRLEACIVVPAADPASPLIERLGLAGAKVLRGLVKPGDSIGVAWGRTVMAVARAMAPTVVPDLSVVQATGGLTATFDFSPELCASRLAQALGARSINISAPAIVSHAAVRDVLMAEPILAEQFALARSVDKILFGVCSTRPDSLIYESALVTPEDVGDPVTSRATAVVAGRLIDDRGRPILGALDDRTIGLTLAEIGRIRTRIAVAGGADKVPAILAVLRGRHANILVTDAKTGHGILQAEGVPAALGALRGRGKTQLQGGTAVKTKKLINDPKNIIEEMLEGIVKAHPTKVRQLPENSRSLVAVDGPRPGKVGIVVGGGSGHEPSFLGFVGKGLADACAVGNVFASPPPDPILECTKAASGGAGVLYLYGNYAGDVMNFDMAAEMAAMEDIEVRTVVTLDDVASAPRDQRDKRRGVAGNFFVFKIAGAAADKMWTLDEVERVAQKANASTFTVGVALYPCSLPQTLKHNFEIGENEMEIGMGIHGEPGIVREPLKSADEVTDAMLERIFDELPTEKGGKVAVLINSLGSTPLMELYVVNRRVHQRLEKRGIAVHANWVGTYCSSLEMAGMSVTLIHLDAELTELLDHPCDCAMFRAG